MTLFARYLQNQLLRGYLLVTVVLVGLFSLITLAGQLDDTSKGRYEAADALLFTFLTAPKQFFDLLPMITLLGTVFALGMMAGSSQLVAIRALGASLKDLLLMVLRTGLWVIITTVLLAQWVIPELEKRAHTMRLQRIASDSSLLGEHGFWARNDRQFINIQDFELGRIPTDISIYTFSENLGLLDYKHARSARIDRQGDWLLEDVWVKNAGPGGNRAEFHHRLRWQSFLTPAQLDAITVPPESLAPTDLYLYIRDLRSRGQAFDRYSLALWRQLSVPVAALLMILVAVPVATGSSRASTAAKRIFQSSAVGLLFYLATIAIGFFGLLAGTSPVLTTFGPLLLLGLVAWWMIRRMQ